MRGEHTFTSILDNQPENPKPVTLTSVTQADRKRASELMMKFGGKPYNQDTLESVAILLSWHRREEFQLGFKHARDLDSDTAPLPSDIGYVPNLKSALDWLNAVELYGTKQKSVYAKAIKAALAAYSRITNEE